MRCLQVGSNNLHDRDDLISLQGLPRPCQGVGRLSVWRGRCWGRSRLLAGGRWQAGRLGVGLPARTALAAEACIR